MIARGSLTARLIGRLFVVQALAFVAAWFLTSAMADVGLIGASGFTLGDTFRYHRVRDLVVDSLARAEDGSLRIEPQPALRDEMERTPSLQYAVFDTVRGGPLRGSSPQLSRVIGEIAGVDLRGIVFFYPEYSPEARPGSMWQWRTKFGPMFVAVTGYAPSWSDIPYALRNSMTSLAVNLAAVFSMSVVVAWLVVRDGLAPLRSAAAAAERLDFDSIGQGVAAEGAPSEVAPLIDAVNGALKRLDAAATRMRRYTANAAHELRTPVAILRARLENPEERSFKADLERDARRIQGIVEQMLIAARLTERQATLDDRIDLVAAIRSTVADYSPLVYRTKRRIELEAPETPTIIRGNRRALDSIIANLIDNALQAEPAGGMVVVRVTDAAVVEVVDHGAGVPEDARELIFEPFWRKTDTRAGAGLGLAIVKELVELLGGRIAVTATKGGGATFRLTFPQVADPSAAEEGANIC